MNIFAEIARTNAAYCAARGLSGAELYGTPPNAEEFEVSRLIGLGVPAEAAIPRVVERYRLGYGFLGDTVKQHLLILRNARDCRRARTKYRSYYPDTPFERLAKLEQRYRKD